MATTCPSCGMENSDAATECRRCRAPFAEPAAEDASSSLGVICQRCEAYNEPGVSRCTTCGYKLDAPPNPAEPMTPPSDAAHLTISEELKALAISAEEAADAGLHVANGAAATPEPVPEAPPAPPPQARPRGWAAVEAAMAGGSARKAAPFAGPQASLPDGPPPDSAVPALKTCQSCAAENPPAAKFCYECGTPFSAKAPKAGGANAKAEPPPTVTVDIGEVPEDAAVETLPAEDALPDALAGEENAAQEAPEAWAASTDPTARSYGARPETTPIDLQDPSPEPLGWEEEDPGGERTPPEVTVDTAAVAEALEEVAPSITDPLAGAPAPAAQPEPEPPYQATLVVERGSATGTTYLLGDIENVVGSTGAAIELSDDPHLAPRHAALVFDEERLLVRDEGAANGVYVKIRESAALEPGDHFVAGERLLRFDGPCELPVGEPGETPYLGSPRPQGTVVRITEILRGGKTGRTCFRAAPAIAIGRTGCDLNFAADAQLAPRHAELRVAADGTATLVDLGASPAGVLLRLRPQQSVELQAGDVIQLGDQLLRLEVG